MEWNKKLAEYQATPPPPAWNEIENTLRQDESSLYHHTAVPPNESWEAISTKLSSSKNKQPAPVFNLLRSALRYAAMIAFLALATTTLINSSFRNALIESIQGPGTKAALSDTQKIIHLDSNKNKIRIKPLP